MENDLQVKYDSLCYAAFLNIKHLTKDAKRIVLKNVDWNNFEHKFIIHIVHACIDILGNREVAIDVGPMTRNTIRRACPALGRIRKVQKEENIFVNVPDVLEYMRGPACELCGIEFTFGDIYDAYYSGKDVG